MNLVLTFLSINIILGLFLLLSTSNRIHVILYLIYIYICSSLYFMYIGLYLIGLFYLLVYIGAIAMLFLFSIMILDINFSYYNINNNKIKYLSIFLFFIYLFIYYFMFEYIYYFYRYELDEYFFYIDDILKLLGILLFDYYQIVFMYISILLVISLIGSIFITNKKFGYFYIREINYENNIFRNNYIYLSF